MLIEENTLPKSYYQVKKILCLTGIVATYPLAGGRGEIQGCTFKKQKHAGVASKFYLRKTLEKTKKGYANFKNKGLGVVYTWGRY